MRERVPTARYLPVCNVLRQWKTSLILTYRVYTDSMKRVFGEHVRRGLDARGGKKLRTGTHTYMRDNHSIDNNKIIRSAEAHTFNIYCTYAKPLNLN